jgi:hypothetical protein
MPKVSTPRRVGRPTTKPKAGVKATLNVRASPALKRRLQAAADRADRSLSAEMELRLEASFRSEDAVGGAQVVALLESLATSALVRFGPGWVHDAHAYDEVTRNDGLWAEHLVRWRPIVTVGPPVVRPDPPVDQAPNYPPPGPPLQRLLQLLEEVAPLLDEMRAEQSPSPPQEPRARPAMRSEESGG